MYIYTYIYVYICVYIHMHIYLQFYKLMLFSFRPHHVELQMASDSCTTFYVLQGTAAALPVFKGKHRNLF